MSRNIADYAMIGDGETAALVHRSGSIDWLCVPRFDSEACFAALLGDENHGRWLIAPSAGDVETSRRYEGDTLILETEFRTDSGCVRLVDFMPMRESGPAVMRLLEGVSGRVDMRMVATFRFGYGDLPPWMTIEDGEAVAEVGPDRMILRSSVPFAGDADAVTADFTIDAGDRIGFTLCHCASNDTTPVPPDPDAALAATRRYWRDWIGKFTRDCAYPDAVRRSLITLKALIHRPTGGLVGAATTSLPEIPGGASNWDYRFSWLRDSTFTLTALLNAGYVEEARNWRDWILRAVAGSPARMQVMYRLDGGRHLSEREIPWLPGHGWAGPVTVGNAAVSQHQADIYGEVIDAFHLGTLAGLERSDRSVRVQHAIATHIENTWREPGAGIWESRGTPRHYVYARAMCWAGIDRFLKGCGDTLDEATTEHFSRLRETIHEEVCREGYHAGLGRFVAYYGGQEIDACLLLLPIVGFLPADDPRMSRTIDAIERELMEGGLVRRQPRGAAVAEGTFIACACWLADCRLMQGRTDACREIIERVMEIRNDVGLLAEEYDVPGCHQAGNFPQALSHLALVNSILGLSGPVLQRGGG